MERGKRGELLDKAVSVGLFLAVGQHKATKLPFYLCDLEPFENETRSMRKLPEEQHMQ